MKMLNLIFLVLIQSCSSYNVKPVSEVVSWKNGKAFVKNQNDKLILKIAVDYVNGNNQSFLVEIENTSDKEVLIEPGAFFVLDKAGQRFSAINPEDEIYVINRQIENRKNILDTRIYDLTDSMLGLTLIAVNRKDADLDARVEKREKEQREAQDEVLYLEKQKLDLESNFIRKTTLPSKGKVYGILKFKNELVAGDLAIILKYEDKEIVVPFQVTQN